MIIDAHTHIGRALPNRSWTVDELIASMDEAKINTSILIASAGIESPTDAVIAASKKYPDRIKAIGAIDNPTFSANQIDQLISYLKNNDIVGVKFYPGYENYFPQDEKFSSLYSFCEKFGKPVIYHTGLFQKTYPGLLKQSHPINIDEVAYHFPQLKIVIAHMGFPWFTDAAAVIFNNEYVYGDISAFFNEFEPIKSEDADTFVKTYKNLTSTVGNYKKFLFGTDWPLYSQKEYVEAAQKLEMTEEEKELVFWKNAQHIFNL